MNNRWRRIVKHTGWDKVATACVHHKKAGTKIYIESERRTMIHPDYLSNDWFDKGNKERVQLGDEVETGWGVAASYISKDELIHLLNGGVLADYTNGEYSHFYQLDDEALEMIRRALKANEE